MIVQKTDVESCLSDSLVKALVALGRAGEPEAACRIAANAHRDLRGSAPRAAAQLNNAMHGLVRMEAMPKRPTPKEQA